MSDLKLSTSFIRAMIMSVIATAVDFLVLVFCTEILSIYYVISVAIGTICGGITGFLLGRHWAFEKADKAILPQALKYIISSGLILVFNVVGVYLITEYGKLDYIYSKIIVSAFVGVFISFGLFRFFVYK